MQILQLAAAVTAFLSAHAVALDFTHEIPPPYCLQSCISQHGNCALCSNSSGVDWLGCLGSTCDPRDYTFAEAYYTAICQDGGYISYETSPPSNVVVQCQQSKRNVSFVA